MNEIVTIHIEWNEHEMVEAEAVQRKGFVIYLAYEGSYCFNNETKRVTLYDGVNIKDVTVKDWYII